MAMYSLSSGRFSALDSSRQHVPRSFDTLPFPSIRCRVHPVVVFTILDAYIRREDEQEYVIGTLLGVVTEGNVVEVTDCFVDRHSLTDEGLLQIIKDHHESMYDLKQKVTPKEQVVGWFYTGSEMTELTCAVHGWFKTFSSVSKFQPQTPLVEPIHLMVDTTLQGAHLSIKAFLQAPLLIVKDACFQFQEIPLEVYTSQSEKAGMALLLKSREGGRKNAAGGRKTLYGGSVDNSNAALSTGSAAVKDGFEAALERLLELLNKASEYVRGVVEQRERPDAEVGRFLMKALCAELVVDNEQFEVLCQTSLQDTLMVAYLSGLARLQFAIAEKLNTSFF